MLYNTFSRYITGNFVNLREFYHRPPSIHDVSDSTSAILDLKQNIGGADRVQHL